MDAEIATLRAENDELYAALGKESPRMKAERESREAAEAHQRELAELEVTALPVFLASLEARNRKGEFDALDQLEKMILREWSDVVQARRAQKAAEKQIEQFKEAFGGALPASWEQARREWLAKQPPRPEETSGRLWRRTRVFQIIQSLVGKH
mgnify:CR=1 FL=1